MRQEIRELAAAHGIDIDAEEARWDRARQIQREREEHEFDDMPALEPGTPPSSQDPMASVPEIDDQDTCPDPPEDISDDDSDFEH